MRSYLPLCAVLLLAGATIGPKVFGQGVYKCGNVYSQAPCPDGVVVDTDDVRTPAQKAQTDVAAAQAAKSAEKMEKDRLALEKAQAMIASKKSQRTGHAASTVSPASAPRTSVKQKKKTPEYFTAGVPAVKKKKAANKSGAQAGTPNSGKTVNQ